MIEFLWWEREVLATVPPIKTDLALSDEKYPSLALALLFACISLIEFGNS